MIKCLYADLAEPNTIAVIRLNVLRPRSQSMMSSYQRSHSVSITCRLEGCLSRALCQSDRFRTDLSFSDDWPELTEVVRCGPNDTLADYEHIRAVFPVSSVTVTMYQGRRHEVLFGGRLHRHPKPPTPKLSFSSDFENDGKCKIFTCVKKKYTEIS